MKILFVVPYTPNVIRVRPYEFVRALLQAGHAVTLAAIWTTEAEQADLERLRVQGARVLAEPIAGWHSAMNSLSALPSRTPLQAVYSWQPRLLDRIIEVLSQERFDAIHVEHLRGSRYALELKKYLATKTDRPPIVWDSVDCISYLFEQAAQNSRSWKSKLLTRFELGRTRRFEARLVEAFDRTLVTSVIDKQALVDLVRQQRLADDGHRDTSRLRSAEDAIAVVPNGVDLAHFGYRDGAARPANRVIFSGKLSYHANVTAALHLVNDIMPQVWQQRPDTEVWLVGKDPAPEVRVLDTDNGNGADVTGRRVVVTGAVPDMCEYLQTSTVAVAPLLYGAGIQNKVLEALACGTPVVASPQAVAALAQNSAGEFVVADSNVEFADAIVRLLASPARRAELGIAGHAYVNQHYSWQRAALQLETIYRSCEPPHPL